MKRIILFAFFVCSSVLLLHADNTQYLGVQLGFTQPITRLNAPTKGNETALSSTIYNGMKVGVVYDATIIKGFGYTFGLNYTFGGNQTDWTSQYESSIYPKLRSRGQYHQLELVVDWQYKFEIAQDTWLILYTGPTIQCGLALQEKWYLQLSPNTENYDYTNDYYNAESTYDMALKRINVTWGIGAGLQYERYFLRGGYDFGIINPYKEQMFNNQDIYTRGRFDQWQIKLGVYLWEF